MKNIFESTEEEKNRIRSLHNIWGRNVARSKSWVENNMQTQIAPKIAEWKNNGGDMTTLERPEINLEKDCPDYQGNKDIK